MMVLALTELASGPGRSGWPRAASDSAATLRPAASGVTCQWLLPVALLALALAPGRARTEPPHWQKLARTAAAMSRCRPALPVRSGPCMALSVTLQAQAAGARHDSDASGDHWHASDSEGHGGSRSASAIWTR